ncbi:MAG: hypothetical protein Q9219_002150 [cf. Caloplaca sp. 3 TL-2023]
MEAIAIISLIAAVISAFRDGGQIVDKIKQKRLLRHAPPPTRLLEVSLEKGCRAVEEAKENGIERFGKQYATGDDISVAALKDILIDLQGSLLRHLVQAQEDDNKTDFTTLVDASDIGRIRTITVLNGLYERILGTVASQSPFGDMGSLVNQRLSNPDDRLANDVLCQLPSPALSPGNSKVIQSIAKQPASPKNQEECESPAAPQPSPRAGFFDRFRRKSSAEDGSARKGNSRSPRIPSQIEVNSPGKRYTNPSAASPLTPARVNPDDDNPWATEGGRHATTFEDPMADPSMSRAPTLVEIQQSRSTIGSISSASDVRMLSACDLHGGFCKGAYKMQLHEKDSMKLRNQSTAGAGEIGHWACCNTKCAFEGPAVKIGKGWTFDDTVKQSQGVRYRWSFLAKAHISLVEAHNGKYDYACVFCIYDGFKCPVFRGIRDFMSHVGIHRGKSIPETMLSRIKCINDRIATPADEFDVNLTPLDTQLEPYSASASPSWTANHPTMADVDPWRNAT